MTRTKEPSLVVAEIAIAIVLSAIAIPWTAFVLSTLWAWFIVPFGAPAIGIVAFVGIMLLKGLLWRRKADPNEDFGTSAGRLVGDGILRPALALLIGWIAISVAG